ncbi:phosphotransferase [Nocardioides sp. B-3]|uniref:phosphotransferase n=1 Tax=Nocardioides sp. B-3 TaxID=2895565 RepID=UPI0021536D08|nr:phosphotransferase [Nocardioides sp. B-3]UUZ61377.1 phosphotransferase [Nocardioides sp. B-3]
MWSISAVARVPTDGGDLWLKAPCEHFPAEGSVHATVSRLFPDLVPILVAVNEVEGWLLMKPLSGEEDDTRAAGGGLEVATRWAAAQIEAVSYVDELVAGGCRRRGVEETIAGFKQLLETSTELALLTDDELEAVRACDLEAVVREFWAAGIPDTLTHGDLHLGNVARDGTDLRIFDWTDGCVSHPFLDAAHLAHFTRSRPGDAGLESTYAERWRAAYPLADIDTVVRLAPIVDSVFQGDHLRRHRQCHRADVALGARRGGGRHPAQPPRQGCCRPLTTFRPESAFHQHHQPFALGRPDAPTRQHPPARHHVEWLLDAGERARSDPGQGGRDGPPRARPDQGLSGDPGAAEVRRREGRAGQPRALVGERHRRVHASRQAHAAAGRQGGGTVRRRLLATAGRRQLRGDWRPGDAAVAYGKVALQVRKAVRKDVAVGGSIVRFPSRSNKTYIARVRLDATRIRLHSTGNLDHVLRGTGLSIEPIGGHDLFLEPGALIHSDDPRSRDHGVRAESGSYLVAVAAGSEVQLSSPQTTPVALDGPTTGPHSSAVHEQLFTFEGVAGQVVHRTTTDSIQRDDELTGPGRQSRHQARSRRRMGAARHGHLHPLGTALDDSGRPTGFTFRLRTATPGPAIGADGVPARFVPAEPGRWVVSRIQMPASGPYGWRLRATNGPADTTWRAAATDIAEQSCPFESTANGCGSRVGTVVTSAVPDSPFDGQPSAGTTMLVVYDPGAGGSTAPVDLAIRSAY